jgi:hypothetical protein
MKVYDDSSLNFGKVYDELGIKNLSAFLTLSLDKSSKIYQFIEATTNLDEKRGIGLFMYQKPGGKTIEIYAKKSLAGIYEKVYESPADKLSVGYTAEGGANIFLSSQKLTAREAQKLIGRGFLTGILEAFGRGKDAYAIGHKLFGPGWLKSSKATTLSSSIQIFNLALAQEEAGGGEGGFFDTGETASGGIPGGGGGEPTGGTEFDIPLPPIVTKEPEFIQGGGRTKTKKDGSFLGGNIFVGLEITDKGKVEPFIGDPDRGTIPIDPFGGPGAGRGELGPGFTIEGEAGSDPYGLKDAVDRVLDECYGKKPREFGPPPGKPPKELEEELRKPIPPRTIPTEALRRESPQIQPPSIFDRLFRF